ncbi:PREDICTED: homeobox-leucine zipper protein MERISTEM L1-like isoform X2 [Lupinus angustifolius]|uniref:homeobox-leucine zipper protein MERISTEM L1-like isoform X2 n=1 Tax=Lupinus angustifolius TaxID=3871 RepID=UPI00092E8BD9|nr:PREDICTED: homeobox-leucine zipper protein MERISTEM L1-like isoform X2 [Lupinus angustifolius]
MADLVIGNRVEGNEMIMEEAPNNSSDDDQAQQQQQQQEEEEADPNQPAKRAKRYNRHSEEQIQQMEEFFKECPHPNDNQRKELSKHLKLDPSQVKFWFQNKRTQVKAQVERLNNQRLNGEIENLRAELERCQEALKKATCPNCGGPSSYGEMSFDEHHLRMENTRLKEEVQRLSGMTGNHVGNVASSSYTNVSSFQNRMPSHDVGIGSYGVIPNMVGEMYGTNGSGSYLPTPLQVAPDPKRMMIVELVDAAMEELTKLAIVGNPLWFPQNNQLGTEILNEDEYFRTFHSGFGPKLLGFKSEASRDSVVIIKNNINLMEILMDVKQWSKVFCDIVSRSMTHEVLSQGVTGNYNGVLQVMSAEFQVPSPMVPTRRAYFARYCKQHQDGSWVLVDVSLDDIRPNAISTCRRRPSGCLIQDLSSGYSKVTWIEHVEVDERTSYNLYENFVNSGFGFGAKRWLASLHRHCQRLAITKPITMLHHGVITGPEEKQFIVKLAERMKWSFLTGVGSSTADIWTTISPPCDSVRIMRRTSMNDPGRPSGLVLNIATSFRLQIPPIRVFTFLRDVKFRSQWDVLCTSALVQEKEHIATGRDSGNCISLIQVNQLQNENQNMFILQESFTDATGSYAIYAPIDVGPMNEALCGGDPDFISMLPSGFAIVPDEPIFSSPPQGGSIVKVGPRGSLITVAFQILVHNKPTGSLSPNSVASVNNFLDFTMKKIKDSVADDSNKHLLGPQISQQ